MGSRMSSGVMAWLEVLYSTRRYTGRFDEPGIGRSMTLGTRVTVVVTLLVAAVLAGSGYAALKVRRANLEADLDREAHELARRICHAFSLGHAVDFTAFLGHYCRLGAEVRAAAEEEMAIATDQGFQLWHALGTLHKGVGMLLQGRREEALPLLLKGYSAFRATGAEVRVSSYLGILGDA